MNPQRPLVAAIAAAVLIALALLAFPNPSSPRTCFQVGVADYGAPHVGPAIGLFQLSDGTYYNGTNPPPECSQEARTGA